MVFLANTGKQESKSVKPLTGLEYERAFIENYQNMLAASSQIVLLVKDKAPRDVDQRQLQIHVTYLKTLVNESREIVPPKEYKITHISYMKALPEFSWAADNVVRAIVERDTGLSRTCVKKLIKGQGYMNEAVDRLKQGL